MSSRVLSEPRKQQRDRGAFEAIKCPIDWEATENITSNDGSTFDGYEYDREIEKRIEQFEEPIVSSTIAPRRNLKETTILRATLLSQIRGCMNLSIPDSFATEP